MFVYNKRRIGETGGVLIKLLSVAVPSYNSQDYLERCLDTLVLGGEDVEIIVVDDGSTDKTADIAREYCSRYPEIVRLEQKENGGHGSAVNKGLQTATGKYFKVVDSDDWVDTSAFKAVLGMIREREASGESIDLMLTNYVYEYFYNNTRKVISYRNILPQGKVFGWDSMHGFHIDQYLLMHSMIYRTELLRDCGLKLPEHTFYVDNIVAYQPLPYVKKIMYLDVDFYRYFIGRPDQSVNTTVMIKRIDQQLRVTRIMFESYHLFQDVPEKNKRSYMLHYLSVMVAICVLLLNMSKNEENYRKADKLWEDIREYDYELYRALRRRFLSRVASLPGRGGRYITGKCFHLARRIYKFC